MKPFLRAAALLALLAATAWAVRRSGVLGGDPWDPLVLRAWVEGAGLWGPAIFLAVAVVKPMIVPQPLGLAWVAGGLFGTMKGGTLVALSGLGSSFVGYAVGALGRRAAEGALAKGRATRVGQIARALRERASAGPRSLWRTVAFLRAVVPWDLVSYWAGARRMPLKPYLAGTCAALLPVSFGHAYVASAFVAGEGQHLVVAVPLLLGLVFGPLWYFERRGGANASLGERGA